MVDRGTDDLTHEAMLAAVRTILHGSEPAGIRIQRIQKLLRGYVVPSADVLDALDERSRFRHAMRRVLGRE